LKIAASLIHVKTGEETPQDFVELAKIKNGIIESSKIDNPEYNILADEFARRTFDESGDYYVKPFSLELKNSLNDYKGNNGVYESNELTSSGNSPSDDLGVYKLSSGKAYVRGYEVDIPSNLFIDFKKPRETKEFKSQAISYLTGSTLSLNRVYGAPKIGFSTSYTVSLRDERVGASSTVASGKEIGLARVYDFALESGSYDASNSNLNTWDLSLFDVQPFTDIIVNENIQSVQTPTFIKGKSSGAVGFLRYDVSNSGIELQHL
jgi:curved DNA-binding protein CbpA